MTDRNRKTGRKIMPDDPLLDITLSDFSWNIDHENIGRTVKIDSGDPYYDGKRGKVKGLYRSEEDQPIDAYWVAFDDPNDDLWFLPEELWFYSR